MLLYLFLLICSGCLVILNLSSVPVLINMLEFFRLSIIAFLLWLVVRMFSIVQYVRQLTITARQYGEVVLPDASTGQGPDTLARKLSRCKEGMAHFLPSWYKFI
jgi:hypothetical protein